MLTLDAAFQSHIEQETTTLCVCVLLTRTDDVKFGFTSLDETITIGSQDFMPTDSLNASSVITGSDLRVDNLDVQGVLTDDRITESDLLSGKYDGCDVQVFIVNYESLPTSIDDFTRLRFLLRGTLGEIRLSGSAFVAEIRGLKQALSKDHMELFSPLCRVKALGDTRCKVNLTPYTFLYTVSSVIDKRTFVHSTTGQAANYFKYGILRWTGSFPNAGVETTIKEYSGSTRIITLTEVPYFPIAVGQTFRAIRGCDRTISTCNTAFNNVNNFRGEPETLLRGTDKLLSPL